jgi:hypothetical protein
MNDSVGCPPNSAAGSLHAGLCRVLFGYGPLGIKKLTVLEAGDGDMHEMTQHLPSDTVAFCFMQVA